MSRTAPAPHRLLVVGGLALALLLAACGSDDEIGGKIAKDGLGCTVTSVDRTTEVPEIDKGVEVGETTSTTDVAAAGKDACKASASKYLTIDLVGATLPDGKVFSNTFEDDQPLTARLGQGQLLSGLETGINDMAVGATRQIVVPAMEGYGEAGNEAQGIGKDVDLEFVVHLIAVTDAPQYCNPARDIPTAEGKPTDFTVPSEPTEGEVKVTVLREGDGAELTTKSYPTVNYLGISCASGLQFDSSWDRGEPFQFAMADATSTATVGQVIEGWSQGLAGQKVGSIVQIDIPADLAYGSTDKGSIGPNDPLTFVVEILDTTEETPADETSTIIDDTATTTVPTDDSTTTTTG